MDQEKCWPLHQSGIDMNVVIIGGAIVMVSELGGIIFSKRNTDHPQAAVKMMLFGLYFWGLVFLQLLIVASVYVLARHGVSF